MQGRCEAQGCLLKGHLKSLHIFLFIFYFLPCSVSTSSPHHLLIATSTHLQIPRTVNTHALQRSPQTPVGPSRQSTRCFSDQEPAPADSPVPPPGAQPSTIRHGAMAERGRAKRPQKTGAAEAVIYSVHRKLVFVLDNWAKPSLLTNIRYLISHPPTPKTTSKRTLASANPRHGLPWRHPVVTGGIASVEALSTVISNTKVGIALLPPSGQYGISTYWACGCRQNRTSWKRPKSRNAGSLRKLEKASKQTLP